MLRAAAARIQRRLQTEEYNSEWAAGRKWKRAAAAVERGGCVHGCNWSSNVPVYTGMLPKHCAAQGGGWGGECVDRKESHARWCGVKYVVGEGHDDGYGRQHEQGNACCTKGPTSSCSRDFL